LIYNIRYEDVGDPSFERFVGKEAILGSGFQMGWQRFKDQCKAKGAVVSDLLAKKAIHSYRTKHSPVVRMWSNFERAAIAAVKNPGKRFTINRTTWFVEKKFLYCVLPSGRPLAFFGPSVRVVEKWGKPKSTLYHWGLEKNQWVNRATYGGKLTENVVQGVARDLMVHGQLTTEKAGYIALISVHDELLAERKTGTGSLEEFEKLMAELPAWAEGLPVKVKGWCGERYKK
jgi:DNA polymerase